MDGLQSMVNTHKDAIQRHGRGMTEMFGVVRKLKTELDELKASFT